MGGESVTASRPWIQGAPADYATHRLPNGEPAFIHKTSRVNNVTIGRFSYISHNCAFGGEYPIRIGAFCSIAHQVYCWTRENHQTRYVSSYPLRSVLGMDIGYSEIAEERKGVSIGNDVWVCSEARIRAGVSLGDGCVIGARAVVTRDCEPYGIYAGVPARLMRKRFPEQVIAELLELQWWTWPLDRILRNSRFFSLDLEHLDAPLSSFVIA